MKTPEEIAERLRRQWQQADKREARLSVNSKEWPLRFPIGRPPASLISEDIEKLRAHIESWKAVNVGRVEWKPIPFRAAGSAIDSPVAWCLDRPSEWVAACSDKIITAEYTTLSELCRHTPPSDHILWIRQCNLWRGHPTKEIIRASQLADALEPACAQGRPLRALPYAGVDTKFYERHRALIIRLLDLRHNGAASEQGLEVFLDAAADKAHWLLVADLDGRLLPFKQQRVRADELAQLQTLPGSHLIIVENERALHLLPNSKETLAVLGSGNNLNWLSAGCIAKKRIAYWGDLDTWGLRLLAQARQHSPKLTVLLMDSKTFASAANNKAVIEPEPAPLPRKGLTTEEHTLFQTLVRAKKGRLEQEFLPEAVVRDAVSKWRNASSPQ
ncbi:MAG: hypothetical protein EA353_10645 [Puniceicoccaceae bacterium]|nr:MAG: hypothetical protein EA353_10645 [Puniceicoccaceae bacterium]